MIALIVAHANNHVIGKNNELPWYIPEDLRYFKEKTSGNNVIMGRNTYLSIIDRIGKPLPNRRNIVVSKTLESVASPAVLADSLTDAMSKCDTTVDTFIIGGARLYEAAIKEDILDTMLVTEVHVDIDGDTYFPDIESDLWQEAERKPESNSEYSFDFVVYKKADR